MILFNASHNLKAWRIIHTDYCDPEGYSQPGPNWL